MDAMLYQPWRDLPMYLEKPVVLFKEDGCDKISVLNESRETYIFKVKTTSVDRYKVTPCLGLIPAGGRAAISVVWRSRGGNRPSAGVSDIFEVYVRTLTRVEQKAVLLFGSGDELTATDLLGMPPGTNIFRFLWNTSSAETSQRKVSLTSVFALPSEGFQTDFRSTQTAVNYDTTVGVRSASASTRAPSPSTKPDLLQQVFRKIDTDFDGFITKHQIIACFRGADPEVHSLLGHPSESTLAELEELLSTTGNLEMDFKMNLSEFRGLLHAVQSADHAKQPVPQQQPVQAVPQPTPQRSVSQSQSPGRQPVDTVSHQPAPQYQQQQSFSQSQLPVQQSTGTVTHQPTPQYQQQSMPQSQSPVQRQPVSQQPIAQQQYPHLQSVQQSIPQQLQQQQSTSQAAAQQSVPQQPMQTPQSFMTMDPMDELPNELACMVSDKVHVAPANTPIHKPLDDYHDSKPPPPVRRFWTTPAAGRYVSPSRGATPTWLEREKEIDDVVNGNKSLSIERTHGTPTPTPTQHIITTPAVLGEPLHVVRQGSHDSGKTRTPSVTPQPPISAVAQYQEAVTPRQSPPHASHQHPRHRHSVSQPGHPMSSSPRAPMRNISAQIPTPRVSDPVLEESPVLRVPIATPKCDMAQIPTPHGTHIPVVARQLSDTKKNSSRVSTPRASVDRGSVGSPRSRHTPPPHSVAQQVPATYLLQAVVESHRDAAQQTPSPHISHSHAQQAPVLKSGSNSQTRDGASPQASHRPQAHTMKDIEALVHGAIQQESRIEALIQNVMHLAPQLGLVPTTAARHDQE